MHQHPMLEIVKDLVDKSQKVKVPVRYSWISSQSKNPRHLRFGPDKSLQLGYMRDGIMMVNGGKSGSYTRIKEFAGPNSDEHEIIMTIDTPIFDENGNELL